MVLLAGFFKFCVPLLRSVFLYQSRPKLFRPLIPSSARGINGGPRRSTEVVLNEQFLPGASMKSSRSKDATSATRAKTSLAAMAAVAILASIAAPNDYGLESAKPDLQSTFKKPGRGVIRQATRVRTLKWGLLRCIILAQKRESGTGNSPRSGSAGSRDASPVVQGIGCVMVSGAAAGCQADRARRRAFGVGTRGG